MAEIERATVPRRAGRLFLSGTTEIRVGGSNGGRGESSRTGRAVLSGHPGPPLRGHEKKGNGNHEQKKETRVVLPRALANARVIAPRIENGTREKFAERNRSPARVTGTPTASPLQTASNGRQPLNWIRIINRIIEKKWKKCFLF